MKAPISIPADIFDTIEMSVLVHEGIGAGVACHYRGDDPIPCCVVGHCSFASGYYDPSAGPPREHLVDLLWAALPVKEWGGRANDRAVRSVNKRKGVVDLDTKISWEEYITERDWVRGAT